MMNDFTISCSGVSPILLISGNYNVFSDGWDSAGVYMASGLYKSETFSLPIYIGSSVNLQERIESDHISTLNRNKHPHNPPLQYSWNKYGQNNFVWWLLESCKSEETLIVEQKYLDLYRPFVDEFRGFNIGHFVTSSTKGRKLSEETRLKLCAAQQKRVANPNYRPPRLGQLVSNNARKKMSQARKGKSAFWNVGLVRSEENRKKISDSLKGNIPWNKGKTGTNIQPSRKPLRCIENGEIYNSIYEASKKTGISHVTLSRVLSGKRKTTGGFHWELIKKE